MNDVSTIDRNTLHSLLNQVLANHGKSFHAAETDALASLGFSSLDLAELTVRLEDHIGKELSVEAAEIRPLRTVGDVLDLLSTLSK